MWYEIFAAVYFCGVVIFCLLQKLILMRFGQNGFFGWVLIFAIFRKNPVPSTQHWWYFRFYWIRAIEIHIFKQYSAYVPYVKPVGSLFTLFVSERKRQVVIEQTRFLSPVFLCSEFKLENIYFGANFLGKNVCGNFHLRELIFADRWTERLRTVAFHLLFEY